MKIEAGAGEGEPGAGPGGTAHQFDQSEQAQADGDAVAGRKIDETTDRGGPTGGIGIVQQQVERRALGLDEADQPNGGIAARRGRGHGGRARGFPRLLQVALGNGGQRRCRVRDQMQDFSVRTKFGADQV
jgi:hypothetical protein